MIFIYLHFLDNQIQYKQKHSRNTKSMNHPTQGFSCPLLYNKHVQQLVSLIVLDPYCVNLVLIELLRTYM